MSSPSLCSCFLCQRTHAQTIWAADAISPNTSSTPPSGHFGKPAHGFTRALQLLMVASVALLLLAAAAVVTLASFAVGTGVIRLSTLGETAELAGTHKNIPLGEYWG